MDIGSLRFGAIVLAGAATALGTLGLAVVGLASWVRTSPLRTGRGPVPGGGELEGIDRRPTSRTTFVAGGTGLAVAVAGLVALLTGDPRIGVLQSSRVLPGLAATAGGFVAFTGLAWRVTSLAVDLDALTVGYARRRPDRLAWSEVRRLRPPRTPLSGWQIAGEARDLTLMASDLFGHEDLLAVLARRAGLRFDGRAWVREP